MVAKVSLINRMLQDLEQRRSQGGERGLPAGVRAAAPPVAARRSGWWWVTLAVLLGIIAALLWLLQQRPSVPDSPPVAPVAVQPPVAPVEAPIPEPDMVSLRLADILVMPRSVEDKKIALPPANRARAASSKNDDTEKKAEAIDAVQVKQISSQQQAEFSYQKAVALLQQGRVTEAQESLGESLRAAPDHVASRQVLAGILVEKKQYAQAEQLLRDGLGRGGSQPEFAMAAARIQVERGDGGGALETLQQNLPSGKDHAGYQAFLAALLQRQGQHKQAIGHYQAALRLAPTASALVGVGISLQAENRLTDALEAFKRAKNRGGLSAELQGFVEQRLGQLRQQIK